MSIDASLAKKSYPDRVSTDNKIELESGDYAAVIQDVWVYYVDADGRFTKNRDEATEQKIKFTVVLDDTTPPIALAMELPIRIGKNTFYSKTVEKLSGITDREAHLLYDPKTLVGTKVIASVEFAWKRRKTGDRDEYPWSKVNELRLVEVQVKKPRPVRSNALPTELRQPEPAVKHDDADAGFFEGSDDFDSGDIPF